MSEADLIMRGCGGNKIRVEPTEIRAEGGPEYPRLIVFAKLDLNPIRGWQAGEQHFVILNFQCGLFLQGHQFKIADAISNFAPSKVLSSNTSSSYNIEFPLDLYRIVKIEEKRRGDLRLRLDLRFLIGLYEPLVVQSGEKQRPTDFLTEFESPSTQINLEVPKSHWVEKVLPSLGYLEYFLVEIPKGKKVIQDAWNYLEKAESAFTRWETKAVFANCREMGVLLDKTIKGKFGETDFTFAERWSRAYKQFNHFASMDLHLEDIKKSTKYTPTDVKVNKPDAEHLLFITKSLLKYAEELLQEAE